METAAGDRSTLYLPEHFDGANGAMTENGKHPRCEYDKVASEALERGPASAGTAAGEDGHGAMNHSVGWTRGRRGMKTTGVKTWCRSLTKEIQRRDAHPKCHPRLTQEAAEGEKGEGEPLPSSARPLRTSRAQGETPNTADQDPPARKGKRTRGTRGGIQAHIQSAGT